MYRALTLVKQTGLWGSNVPSVSAPYRVLQTTLIFTCSQRKQDFATKHAIVLYVRNVASTHLSTQRCGGVPYGKI